MEKCEPKREYGPEVRWVPVTWLAYANAGRELPPVGDHALQEFV